MSDWKSLAIILPNSVRLEKSAIILPNSVRWWMVIVMMWLVLYDVNYIYRRMTPRFVDYDEVGAGKIKQSLTFHLNDITWYKLHISLDDSDICRLWWSWSCFPLEWWQNKNFTFPFHFFWWSIIGHLDLLWQARVKGDKEEFAKLLNVEDIEEEEAELDSSISNPPDEPWPADSLLL